MDYQRIQLKIDRFIVDTVALCSRLPEESAVKLFAERIIKNVSCIGTSFRSTSRILAFGPAVEKLNCVIEKTDETRYLLRLLSELLPIRHKMIVDELVNEAGEILAALNNAIRATRNNLIEA